jgi:hypothetical protein
VLSTSGKRLSCEAVSGSQQEPPTERAEAASRTLKGPAIIYDKQYKCS